MRLFARKPKADPVLPPGLRVYAVGDIHGRLDLLNRLLALSEADNRGRAPMRTMVILLGDLIDRGPDSAAVIRRAMEPLGWAQLRALRGNHEAALLDALDGDRRMLAIWLRNGGAPALRSWGLDPATLLATDSSEDILDAVRAAIPAAERAWLAACPLFIQLGNYFFTHAGIRPGVKLDAQTADDMLWIREEFLDSDRDHGAMVVHGHSVAEEIEQRPNRIGLDTGAYYSGRLTALGLERGERWLLQT
jgi:serine/threonine protein phosphatase 1